jgi:hypothetical protein
MVAERPDGGGDVCWTYSQGENGGENGEHFRLDRMIARNYVFDGTKLIAKRFGELKQLRLVTRMFGLDH